MSRLVKKRGKWVVRWREGGRGSKELSSQSFPTKNDAKKYQIELDAKNLVDSGSAAKAGKSFTLPMLVAIYMRQRPKRTQDATAREKYDAEVKRAFDKLFERHPKWVHPKDITRNDWTDLKFGDRRYVKSLLLLARSMGISIENGILDVKIERPRRTPQTTLLTREQIQAAQALADTFGPGVGLAVHLLATYGHRPQSIVLLNQESFDPQTNLLTLSIKSGDVHRHPVLPATAERIAKARTYIQETTKREPRHSDPLVPAHFKLVDHRFPTGQVLCDWYRRCIGAIIHPESTGIYNLKRYAISSLIQAKQDPKTIASITGHRTTSLILNTYARTNQESQEKALEAIKNLI